jgi:hypothetical protein
LALLLSCHALFGCELIADFDRDKLDAGATPKDAGKMPLQPDEPEPDAGQDDLDAG